MPAVQVDLQLLRCDPTAGRLDGLANRPHIKALAAELRRKDSTHAAAYTKVRRFFDPLFRAVLATRCRARTAIKSNRADGHSRLLGCTPSQFRAHLQSLFKPGMSWGNYGEWEIDHRRPCCSFNLSQESEQRACFHFTNLQPLWKADNRRKGGKWPHR